MKPPSAAIDSSFPAALRDFWAEPPSPLTVAAPLGESPGHDWIVHHSGLPWLPLVGQAARHRVEPDVARRMAAEARVVEPLAVPHRDDHSHGWRSLCLHGLDAASTRGSQHYGFADPMAAPYAWTDIADRCPATRAFVEGTFAFERLNRVRFMILDPGGYILPHRDLPHSCLAALNMAITHPSGAYLKLRGAGFVPFDPYSAFLIDIGREHACINLSNEPRIHIIVHGERPAPPMKALVEDAYRRSTAPGPPSG